MELPLSLVTGFARPPRLSLCFNPHLSLSLSLSELHSKPNNEIRGEGGCEMLKIQMEVKQDNKANNSRSASKMPAVVNRKTRVDEDKGKTRSEGGWGWRHQGALEGSGLDDVVVTALLLEKLRKVRLVVEHSFQRYVV